MTDRVTKWLLLLIAIGLFLNAGAMFYRALTPVAYASGERMYIEGGNIKVTLDRPVELRIDRDLPVKVSGAVKLENTGTYDTINVKVTDVVKVQNQ